MVLKSILDPNVGLCLFNPAKGVCPFGNPIRHDKNLVSLYMGGNCDLSHQIREKILNAIYV